MAGSELAISQLVDSNLHACLRLIIDVEYNTF